MSILKYKNKKPEADNKKSSISQFFHRNVYKHLEKVRDEEKMIINLWDNKIKYGRVDNYDNPVFPKERYLKLLPEKIKLINFVADAFEEFRIFWTENSGCSDESIFKDLVPTKGWENVNVLYRNHFEKIYKNFYSEFVIDFKQNNKIVDFFSFVELFQVYIERIGYRISITRSKFLTTKYSSPFISGLAVEIGKEDYSKDINKFEKYIEDPKFTFYKNSALRYGFFIDKNAPWRLYANINSPALEPYMKKYNISSKYLFKEYFYKAEQYDLKVLKTVLFNFYNSFVTTYPVFKVPNGGSIEREYLRVEELEQILNKFWFSFLIQTKRIEETSKPFENHIFGTYLKKSLDIEEYIGFNEAVDYINNITSS